MCTNNKIRFIIKFIKLGLIAYICKNSVTIQLTPYTQGGKTVTEMGDDSAEIHAQVSTDSCRPPDAFLFGTLHRYVDFF